MLKTRHNVIYEFIGDNGSPHDKLKRIGEKRVPQVGEYIHFTCRGDRHCKVLAVTTMLAHDPEKVSYKVEVGYED